MWSPLRQVWHYIGHSKHLAASVLMRPVISGYGKAASIPTTAYVNFINASKLYCRLDFFTYRNLFQNEISDDFSSKSLLKLLIHSNAHIHNYRSRKKRLILELEIRFRLYSSSILLEPHGIVTSDLYLIKFIFNRFIHLGIILIVCSHKILLFSSNYHLVIDRNNLDNILTILLAIKKNNNFNNNGYWWRYF